MGRFVAVTLASMGRALVPNCPGRNLGQFRTRFWSIRNSLTATTGPQLAGPGTGSFLSKLKYRGPILHIRTERRDKGPNTFGIELAADCHTSPSLPMNQPEARSQVDPGPELPSPKCTRVYPGLSSRTRVYPGPGYIRDLDLSLGGPFFASAFRHIQQHARRRPLDVALREPSRRVRSPLVSDPLPLQRQCKRASCRRTVVLAVAGTGLPV